jgi:hypothetical protein
VSILPPSQSAPSRAARRVLGRDGTVRRGIEHAFARRRARRALVGAWVAVVVAAAALPLVARLEETFGPALLVGGTALTLVTDPLPAFALSGLLGLTLRTAVRREADRPDDDMDELQIARRDRAYLVAYRIVASSVSALLVAGYVVADVIASRPVAGAVEVWLISDLLFVVVPLVIFLPSAVLAWYAPDETEDDA